MIKPDDKGALGVFFILLSLFYGIGVRFRLFLYATGILRARKIEGVKVISVGNLTVGGAGKTPFAVMLANMMNEKTAIVSRGYGRSSTSPVQIVSDGSQILASYPDAADEALLCAAELKNSPVICSPRRTDGIRCASEKFGTRVVVLDDAFSHLAAHRDKNILLVDALDPFGNGRLLPAGRLREPVSSARRADAAVITRSNFVSDDAIGRLKKELRSAAGKDMPVFLCEITPAELTGADGTSWKPEEFLKGKKVSLLSGIASPGQFETTIRKLGAQIQNHYIFEDHHPFSQKDIAPALEEAGKDILITTKKDFIRLPANAKEKFGALKVRARIKSEECETFRKWISS